MCVINNIRYKPIITIIIVIRFLLLLLLLLSCFIIIIIIIIIIVTSIVSTAIIGNVSDFSIYITSFKSYLGFLPSTLWILFRLSILQSFRALLRALSSIM